MAWTWLSSSETHPLPGGMAAAPLHLGAVLKAKYYHTEFVRTREAVREEGSCLSPPLPASGPAPALPLSRAGRGLVAEDEHVSQTNPHRPAAGGVYLRPHKNPSGWQVILWGGEPAVNKPLLRRPRGEPPPQLARFSGQNFDRG